MERQFAKRLLSLMGHGESIDKFASRIGYSRQTIHSWETGKHGVTLGTVKELSKKLNVDPRWLGFGDPEYDDASYHTGTFSIFWDEPTGEEHEK